MHFKFLFALLWDTDLSSCYFKKIRSFLWWHHVYAILSFSYWVARHAIKVVSQELFDRVAIVFFGALSCIFGSINNSNVLTIGVMICLKMIGVYGFTA